MGKSNSIEELFKAINKDARNKKEIDKQLKDIESLANKVLKEHKTLNLLYKAFIVEHTPLSAAMYGASVPVFQLLLKLGADPFFKPKPDMPSAMESLADDYFSFYSSQQKAPIFKWMMQDKESPVFTWVKLNDNQKLFDEFNKAGLIPEEQEINELPIHIAIAAGRIDLVRGVIRAAGSIQRAGDICRMSILRPAILAVLKGQKNALEMLTYLLEQGASTHTSDETDLPAIMQAITAGLLYLRDVKEEAVIEVVKLLLKHGATLADTNPFNGRNPLMSAMSMGYKNLFDLLLGMADATALNHKASIRPNYLIFQLFEWLDNKLGPLDILKLLSDLKEKGLEFDKTTDSGVRANPFGDSLYSDKGEVSAQNMSLLHCYISNLTFLMEDPFRTIDKHLEIIQTLIANGANPKAKAIFTQTKNVKDKSSNETKKVQTSIELTASEYARKIANELIGRFSYGSDAYLIKTYPDENEFLKQIIYNNKEEQIRLHNKFHQFRNLVRVLSGEKIVPYSGLPDIEKIAQLALNKQKPVVAPVSEPKSAVVPKPVIEPGSGPKPVVAPKPVIETDDFDPKKLEAALINARAQQNQGDWQALKKSIVDYVKEVDSPEDFLARVEQFKKPLQLHFNITTNSQKEVVSYGSMMYRLFHFFDPHKFPNSWETLRKFGHDTYGIDINTQYEQNNTCQF